MAVESVAAESAAASRAREVLTPPAVRSRSGLPPRRRLDALPPADLAGRARPAPEARDPHADFSPPSHQVVLPPRRVQGTKDSSRARAHSGARGHPAIWVDVGSDASRSRRCRPWTPSSGPATSCCISRRRSLRSSTSCVSATAGVYQRHGQGRDSAGVLRAREESSRVQFGDFEHSGPIGGWVSYDRVSEVHTITHQALHPHPQPWSEARD
ncbi:hypothetical protein Krad_2432 [Kineococcus radiotolerans SRS30216 = ATCC BAA-149]|uniref:Uncharacterized protein n=1 Tax=Kineococcus radiotolerans (strain ATCC BAA-149 / DSM 14245 / SRS30216) TaxID=266940 RepID=A6WAS3_KINRD|nr:hypothetical protein Krad_2432 [Kineococcus radiotolerans SRS30216 = ATCC BAA-149]